MNPLLLREKKDVVRRRSSMVAPSNFMQGVSIPASLLQSPRNIPLQEVSCNVIPSMVTGLNPPLLYYEGRSVNHHASHHAGDYFHVHLDVYKHSLRQPDYTDKATRLQSFKYWDGPLPPAELVDAGFYMIAPRDTVRCYSCKVVVRNWRKGDSPIDVHCLYSPNCNFVKNCIQKLIEVNDDGMASRDAGGVTNHQLNNERLVIKNRVKEEGASIHSVGPEIEQPTADKAPTPQVINRLIAGINYPPSQRSVSTYGHVIKASSTKLSEDILDSPPWEEIIFSERRLCEDIQDNGINKREDEARIVVPRIMCKICYIKQVDHVLLPCGDAKTCEQCARQIFKSGRPCYFCNQLVATFRPIYL